MSIYNFRRAQPRARLNVPEDMVRLPTHETFMIRSGSRQGLFHKVQLSLYSNKHTCTCEGGAQHGHCRHITRARYVKHVLECYYVRDVTGMWDVLTWRADATAQETQG